MNNLIAYRHSFIAIVMMTLTFTLSAQKNNKESFEVSGDDITVTVNTSYTNIIFETWNKDKVEVEAIVEGDDLTDKQKQEIFDNWNFEVLGNSARVVISSHPNAMFGNLEALSALKSLNGLKLLDPLMSSMPVFNADFNMPPMPKELLDKMGTLKFDYEEFEKDEEGYMKKWEDEVKNKFGKDFEAKMQKWGDEFAKEWNEKNGAKISEEWTQKMKAWEAKFGKEMEAWGENFGQDMEKWAEEFEKKHGKNGNFTKKVITTPNGDKTIFMESSNGDGLFDEVKAKKTLIIRMPKDAKTEIDVRHGEIKMADAINVKATLNYTSFTANSVDGGETLINAAYAPVIIKDWKRGTLYVKFVDNCTISTVGRINIRSNSSDIYIGTITQDADLTGSLGTFRIDNVSENFGKINITLKNNDAFISTPNTDFTFYFTGQKSTLRYPKSLELTNTKKDGGVYVQGFKNRRNPNRTFNIDALYSNLQVE